MQRPLIILAILVVLTPACVWTPQAVILKPEIQQTIHGSIGQGRAVLLTVVDERPRTTLGTRAVKGMGAESWCKVTLRTLFEQQWPMDSSSRDSW